MRSRRWTRCLALVWAALQVASPVAAAIADATLAAEAARSYVHIEAPGSATCPQAHAPDCGICRSLTTGGRVASPCALPTGPGRDRVPFEALASGAASAIATLPHSRAPPLG